MNHHLTRRHRVENKEELALLLALASGRFKGRLSCPVCDKTRLARLDRHLSKTHKVEGMDREQMLTEAKRECIIRGLAELRSRAPTPPLVSELDVGQTARACAADADADTTSAATAPPTPSRPPSPSPSPSPSPAPIDRPGESEARPSTSTSAGRKPSPKGRSPKVPHLFATSVIGKVLEDFREFYLGAEPTRKDRENAGLRKSHTTRFILHMLRHSKTDHYTDLKCLNDMRLIRE